MCRRDSVGFSRARVVDVLPIERSGIGRAAEALPEWLYRWVVRRQLHRTLDTRPDRLLADVGFDRERLDEQIAAVANALVERRRNRLRIQRELMAYSDRELADVGVSRSDIPAIARGEIPASIALMAANPDTAAAPTPAPANDGVRTAAA